MKAPPDTGYDWVTGPAPDGTDGRWTRTQFEALNLLDRVRLLAGGQLRFFRAGEEVSARAALRQP